MRHYSDPELVGLVSFQEAMQSLAAAFGELARGEAAIQSRTPTDAGGLRLNTMAAILPRQGYCGAKVYTSFRNHFSFVVLLFSLEDGRILASFDAGELTALRTAAVSALAARYLARTDAANLTVFGTGPQAASHVAALVQLLPIRVVRVVSRGDATSFLERIGEKTGTSAMQVDIKEGVQAADVIVTATRSSTPLFDGRLVSEGCFIAAVGSAVPRAAEIDASTVSRCSKVVVEVLDHAQREAGDLIQAERSGAFCWTQAITLGDLLVGAARGRESDSEITLFDSVGCALEDVAMAALAYEKLQGVR